MNRLRRICGQDARVAMSARSAAGRSRSVIGKHHAETACEETSFTCAKFRRRHSCRTTGEPPQLRRPVQPRNRRCLATVEEGSICHRCTGNHDQGQAAPILPTSVVFGTRAAPSRTMAAPTSATNLPLPSWTWRALNCRSE